MRDERAGGRLLTIGRRTRQRIAQLHGGDRLFVSEGVAGYLARLREIGISERTPRLTHRYRTRP